MRKLYVSAVIGDGIRRRIHPQSAHGDGARIGYLRAAEYGADTPDKFGIIYRLYHIIVNAQLEALHLVLRRRLCRKEDKRDVVAAAAHLGYNLRLYGGAGIFGRSARIA